MKSVIRLIAIVTSILILSACATTRTQTLATKKDFSKGKTNFLAKNYKRAFKFLIDPAKKGNSDAQYAIGYMYYYGKGVAQNIKKGRQWIAEAAANQQKEAVTALKLIDHVKSTKNKKS